MVTRINDVGVLLSLPVCVLVHVLLVQDFPPPPPPAALTPQPLHPWGDNYLLVMDKVGVPAVEVVRPGH